MFFLLSIISIALCSQLENQLNTREFQEIIEDFVEVHKVASHNTNLGILIASIRNTINKRSKEYNQYISSFRNSCENARSKVSGFVKSLNSQITEYQNNKNDFNSDIKKAQKSNLENSKNLKTTQKRLKSLKEDMTKLIVDYHAGAAESDEKIGVAKYLIDTIHDKLIHSAEENHPVKKAIKKAVKSLPNSHKKIKKAIKSHKTHHSAKRHIKKHGKHGKSHKRYTRKYRKNHRRNAKKLRRSHAEKLRRRHSRRLRRANKRHGRRLRRANKRHGRKHRRTHKRHRKNLRKVSRRNKHKKGKKYRKVKKIRRIRKVKPVRNSHGFIQLGGDFKDALSKFQNMILKSGDSSYSAIIGSLVELSTQRQFADKSILLNILKLLEKLKKNLEKFRAEKEKDINVTLTNYRNQQANLESQIKEYSHLGERYLSLIAEGHQNIQVLESDIKDLQSEITRKQSELTSLTKLCENENIVFQKIEKSGKLLLKTLATATNLALKI